MAARTKSHAVAELEFHKLSGAQLVATPGRCAAAGALGHAP